LRIDGMPKCVHPSGRAGKVLRKALEVRTDAAPGTANAGGAAGGPAVAALLPSVML
jgi:hypothetical protein